METPRDTTDILEAAKGYAKLGLPIIPLNGKVPAVKQWQQFFATAVSLRFWFGSKRCNIGLRTGESGYIVVDTDTDQAEAWVRGHLPETPMRVRSGAGSTHRYFGAPPIKEIRNRQGWKGIQGLDIRGQGGFIVLPPSVHPETGNRYEWTGEFRLPAGLPRFSPRWIYQRTRHRLAKIVQAEGDRGWLLYRARQYMQKIEPAVSGQGGHAKTFGAACRLAKIVNYDAELLWTVLEEYNARCLPPWSEAELKHKWSDALKTRA